MGPSLAQPERRALTQGLFPQGPLDVTLTQPVRSGPISDRWAPPLHPAVGRPQPVPGTPIVAAFPLAIVQ